MSYTREELDWIEAEWAYHLHGRSAFLSREDYLKVEDWSREDVPADAVVAAMDAYFERRAKRARPRTFVALAHLERDVQKASRLREALRRAGDDSEPDSGAWDKVGEPLKSDRQARGAFDAWRRLHETAPLPDHPAFLDHFDAERQAFRDLAALAEKALGPRIEALQTELRARLLESGIAADSLVWKRAWDHHWNRMVCDAWNISA